MQQVSKMTKAKRGVLLLAFALLCGLTVAMAAFGGKTSASAADYYEFGEWSYDSTITEREDGTIILGTLRLSKGQELPIDLSPTESISYLYPWCQLYFARGEFTTCNEIDNADMRLSEHYSWGDSVEFNLFDPFFKRGCTYSCYVFAASGLYEKNHIDGQEDKWENGLPDGYTSGDGAYKRSDVFTFTIPGVPEPLPEDPQKEGHHFVGWYLDQEFSNPYLNTPINEDTTLYAKFEINRYTVSFHSMGGSSVASTVVDWNTVLTDLPIPSQRGHDFFGWYIDDDTPYTDQPIKQDTVLVAKWQVHMFTVTFMVDGKVYRELEVPYGTRLADVTAAKSVDLEYYNLYDDKGVALGGETVIEAKTTINAVRMTRQEASATFLVKYNWLLWLWGAITVVGVTGFTICAVWIKKH